MVRKEEKRSMYQTKGEKKDNPNLEPIGEKKSLLEKNEEKTPPIHDDKNLTTDANGQNREEEIGHKTMDRRTVGHGSTRELEDWQKEHGDGSQAEGRRADHCYWQDQDSRRQDCKHSSTSEALSKEDSSEASAKDRSGSDD